MTQQSLSYSISSGIVEQIISFEAEKFQPTLALNLVTQTLYDHYLNRKEFHRALEKNLTGSDVGSHAHIHVFNIDGYQTYIWGSDTSRPFGVHLPVTCDNCGLYSPWQRSTARRTNDPKKSITLRCRLCKAKCPMHTIDIPEGLQPIHEQTAQKWYIRKGLYRI